ncbi:MAG: hypothetical protein RIQ79_1890 [Verrucomicrobiota bacterium]
MRIPLWTETLVCIVSLLAPRLGAAPVEPPAPVAMESIEAANARLGRGINFGNTLEAPAEGAWGVTLKAEYFRLIREAGFDTVRLPVRWSAHAAATEPFTLDPVFAARVDWAIDQATANGLNIVVNVHHYEALDATPDAELARMTAIWTQLAERYQHRPATVYFELYNEPHDKLSGEKWNAAVPVLLQAVRRTNPTRPVIVGPDSWNDSGRLEALRLPADDQNLIVTVHYYSPFQFTHQGASWVKGADQWLGRAWTGDEDAQAGVRKDLEKAARWGREHKRPIFLGEFGVFSRADEESRARWTRFVATEARRLGLSWAYWEFCSGFGAYDAKAKAWHEPLKAALMAAP